MLEIVQQNLKRGLTIEESVYNVTTTSLRIDNLMKSWNGVEMGTGAADLVDLGARSCLGRGNNKQIL
jgi:hypothetical protein